MEILGLLGHQGVGKNYIAENVLPKILPEKQTVILGLADHFKIDAICKHNLEYDKVFGKKDFETRTKLQIIGTEEGRDKYGYDIWIGILENWMKTLYSRGTKRFIISDLRFQNEVDWVKKLGGIVIKVESDIRYKDRLFAETNGNKKLIDKIIEHPSEKGIDEIKNYDYLVNNNPGNNINDEIGNIINI